MTALRGRAGQVITRLEAEISSGVLERNDKVEMVTTGRTGRPSVCPAGCRQAFGLRPARQP
ncbi:MAG: hypothetical protein CL476_04075 [Acidobacteria bacterium]|jgi:hypothetical protein|nr:hypothetical protein [Acidobacteriota bacterium]